jgi:hypothetical protein
MYLSGTTCYEEGELLYIGRVGKEVSIEDGYLAAQQTILKLLSVVKTELGDLNRVERVIKTNRYLNSAPGFD